MISLFDCLDTFAYGKHSTIFENNKVVESLAKQAYRDDFIAIVSIHLPNGKHSTIFENNKAVESLAKQAYRDEVIFDCLDTLA